MRRQTFEKGSEDYVEWLKSLGCIMYLPLREDLVERISGISCVPTGKGAYQFTDGYCVLTTPSTSPATVLNITLPDLHSQVNPSYTLLAEVQLVTKSVANNSCRCTLFSNIAISSESAPQWNGNVFRSAIPTDFALYKTARVHDQSATKNTFYLNGAYSSQETINFDASTMTSPYKDGFTIACAGHNNYRNCKFKFRDFMMFNRALTLSEVRQVQGYE